MSLSERRHHSQRMKVWALKQAKREIALYKDVRIGGALERHVTVESWIKRADHPQSKAKWRRGSREYGSMGREKSKVTVSEVRDDLSTLEDDENVDVEVYLHRLIAKCRYESLMAQHEETKEALGRIDEAIHHVLARLLKDLETEISDSE